MNVDASHVPVFIHSVYLYGTGEYLYLRYTYDSEPNQEYLDMKAWADQVRQDESDWVKSAQSPQELKERLKRPMPQEMDWMFNIAALLPWHSYKNDGSRRKKSLVRRLKIQAPLFEEELLGREMAEQPDYFSGNSEMDHWKAEARERYTDEYWDARVKADAERGCLHEC